MQLTKLYSILLRLMSREVTDVEELLRAAVPKNQTFSKYGGNSQKINSAHS